MNIIVLYCAVIVGWVAVGGWVLTEERVSKESYAILWLAYLFTLLFELFEVANG